MYHQEDLPPPAGAQMGVVYQCGRCGRLGHTPLICSAPRRFDGNCTSCHQYGHTSRDCVTNQGPGAVPPSVPLPQFSDAGGPDDGLQRSGMNDGADRMPLAQRQLVYDDLPFDRGDGGGCASTTAADKMDLMERGVFRVQWYPNPRPGTNEARLS
ncbi:unnamed protein product [Pylaiella littoralis]